MQSIDEVIGQLAISEFDIDESYGRGAVGDQAFRVGHGRNRPSDFYSEVLKQLLQGFPNMPSVLNDKCANTFAIAQWSCAHTRPYRLVSCSGGSLIWQLAPSVANARSTVPPIS